jgi:hypothetical protein
VNGQISVFVSVTPKYFAEKIKKWLKKIPFGLSHGLKYIYARGTPE